MNKKISGISLIVLVITIVVILILSATVVMTSGDIIQNTKKSEFAREVYMIQNLLKQYKFRENKYPVIAEVTINMNDIEMDSKYQFQNEPGYAANTIILKEIDLYEAGVENVSRGTKKDLDEKDVYLVSEETGKVYYLKGQKISDKVYYTLDNELLELLGM